MIILCDIDGVCADTVTAVLNRHNFMFDANVKYEDVTEWNIAKFLHRDFPLANIFSSPYIYDDILAIPGSWEGVQELRGRGHRVVFVTSGIFPAKVKWLQSHGFIKCTIDYNYSPDVIICHDKSLVKGDVMIDDKSENLDAFGGYSLLFDQPWNRNVIVPNRYLSWESVIKGVKDYE